MFYKTVSLNKLKSLSRASVISLALVAGSSLFVNTAHAQQSRTITIVPPTFEQSLKPGDKTQGIVKVINDSDTALTFTATPQDYIVQDTLGTPNILPIGSLESKYSAASWIGLDTSTFTIASHDKAIFHYYLQIPQNARPGGHYAAVIYTPSGVKTNGTGAAVNTQIGTLFYIDIAGNIVEKANASAIMATGSKEHGPIKVDSLINNQGDLHIKPMGTVTVTDMLGNKVDQQQLKAQNIFPGASRAYENVFNNGLTFGKYTATLRATYGRSNNLPLMAVVSFWIIPWKIVSVGALALIALVLALILSRRKKKTPPPVQSEATGTPSEQPTQETA